MGLFTSRRELAAKDLQIEVLKNQLERAKSKAEEKTILHVPISTEIVDVYLAVSRKYIVSKKMPEPPEWHGAYFKSCHEAFKVCGDDAEVRKERAMQFADGSLFILPAWVSPVKFWQDGNA